MFGIANATAMDGAGTSGYHARFLDGQQKDGDQAHHFAFLFMVGVAFPNLFSEGLTQWMAARGLEYLQKTPLNQGDVNLGQRALEFGSYLAKGKLAPNALDNEIKKLCK